MAAEAQEYVDLRDLADLADHWEPRFTFGVRYLREGPEWTATPANGGETLTAPSAAELRSLLRRAMPWHRSPE